MPFRYPDKPHAFRHGPRGYIDYRSYKPWLRDEFGFRCVYCLWRETWCADGDASFSVDHLQPRESHPDQATEYDNLVYACCRCNTLKRDAELPLTPAETAWRDHLAVRSDGSIEALTSAGAELIAICRLDRPALTQARRRLLEILPVLTASQHEAAWRVLASFLGFPQNLPVLAGLRPPAGNVRSEGVAASYYERRRRGELAATY